MKLVPNTLRAILLSGAALLAAPAAHAQVNINIGQPLWGPRVLVVKPGHGPKGHYYKPKKNWEKGHGGYPPLYYGNGYYYGPGKGGRGGHGRGKH